jgi:hypothetical protein
MSRSTVEADAVTICGTWFKYGEVYLRSYESVAEAKQGIAAYFNFYNHERLHQALARGAVTRLSGVRICAVFGASFGI